LVNFNKLHFGEIVKRFIKTDLEGLLGSLSPKTIPESPTWPMKSLPRFMKQIDAVVPAVEGRPDAVLRQLGRSFHIAY